MMMEENIAAKQLLKNAWSRSEGLALASIIADDETLPDSNEVEKDISSRASDRLDTVLDSSPEIIDVPLETEKPKTDVKKADLF
jgi:hypothetical protein